MAGASQPSVRPCPATGRVVRAAVCIACGLWGLPSAVRAQAPAPTPDLRGNPIQPWQGGKPVEFRQPRPVEFDQAIRGSSALAKPGQEGVGQKAPWNVEEQVLLPLLLEEKRLLSHYGPDHPDVRSVRERIQIVREYLAKHPPAISVQTPHRDAPNTTASTIRSPGTGRTESNNQAVPSRGQPELIRAVGYSTAGNPIPSPASLAAPPPTVAEAKDKDTHPAATASSNPSARAAVSAPGGAGDGSASQPSQEQPGGHSLFEAGFVQLIGIVGAVLLGTLIHQIALLLILRRYGARLARVFRVELVNPTAVSIAGQVSAAGTHTVAAGPATVEVTQSATAETFDIGPSYAEEMREKQEALRQQEEGLLRHIFEQNMQMREQLGQMSGGAA